MGTLEFNGFFIIKLGSLAWDPVHSNPGQSPYWAL